MNRRSKPPIAPIRCRLKPLAARFFRTCFSSSDPASLRSVKRPLVDRHREGLAARGAAFGDVGFDLGDAQPRALGVVAHAIDLAAQHDLLVEMVVAQALQTGDLRFDPALRISRSSPDAIALARPNWLAWAPTSSMRRIERSPDMAISMKRALRSSVCQPVASTLPLVA